MTPPTDSTAQTAAASAELQTQLAGLSLPAIQQALTSWGSDLGKPGTEPASVSAAYGDIRSGMASDYAQERTQSAAYLKQQALQSGINYSPQAQSEAFTGLSNQLQSQEAQQLRAVNFQEAQAGLNQTNSLLSNITGTAGNVLGGAFSFGGNALQSDQVLQQYQQQARQQGSTYGAAAGTIIGGILGSYFPVVGTAIGAAAGGALGGAAGGYFSGQ